MNNLPDLAYFIILCLMVLGGIIGCTLAMSKSHVKSISKLFKFGYYVFLICWVVSWILALVLILSLPSFQWINSILGPILLIIVGFTLWRFSKGILDQVIDPKDERRLFIWFFASFLALLAASFLGFMPRMNLFI